MAGSRVTTVVISRNRRDQLLRSLAHHEPPVIVIDNGSSDGTSDAVRDRFPDAALIRLGHNLGAPARNIGVACAQTPYVAFADDDSWWEPGVLARAACVFDHHATVGLIAASTVVGLKRVLDPVSVEMERAPLGRTEDLPGPNILGFLCCSTIVRRDAFLDAGGFDDVVFFAGEEERLALDLARRGWHLIYLSDLVAVHQPAGDRDSEQRRRAQIRNHFLTAVMRRPWRMVAGLGAKSVLADRTHRAGMLAAIPRLPRALARRRVVPEWLERQVERLPSTGSVG